MMNDANQRKTKQSAMNVSMTLNYVHVMVIVLRFWCAGDMLTYVDCWTQVKSEMDKLFEELDEGDKASSVEPCSVS